MFPKLIITNFVYGDLFMHKILGIDCIKGQNGTAM